MNNPEKQFAGRLFIRLAHERSVITLAVGVVVVVLLGVSRRCDQTGVTVVKTTWHNCADVVVAGDSRVGSGISPVRMKRFLGEMRILNYGFGGNGYGREYLAALEKVLDPASRQRTIILGISPQSLTLGMAEKNSFLQVRKDEKNRSFALAIFFDKLLRFTSRMRIKEVFGGIFTNNAQRNYRESFADGWVAAYDEPEENHSRYLSDIRDIFNNNKVSPEIVSNLMRNVAQWRGAGIKVYAFRPPTIKEMVKIENTYGGFDERKFIAAFEKAGGVWLEVDQFKYHSYDGCHLRRDGAVALSGDLAQMILECDKAGFKQYDMAAQRQKAY